MTLSLEAMKRGEIDIITMGCSKNLVDSEALARMFSERGYTCVHDPEEPRGEYVVVNTCGFIQDAKQESINMLLTLIEMKKRGQIGSLIAMGCLSERYEKELRAELKEVDRFYGKFNFRTMVDDLPINKSSALKDAKGSCRHTPTHYAYVKISEGCDRRCAFCAIPLMTGRHVSRKMEDIVSEVEALAAEGVKEIQLIAQELTYYGVDLYGKRCIALLVEKLSEVKGIEWLRLHYAYPNEFPMELLEVMRQKSNVCNYLDIAFQHISDHLLSAMQRHFSRRQTIELIKAIRRAVPGIYLRTTLMVGFPTETDEDFEELLDFVREVRFERMGAFMYSEEEGTTAARKYKDDVPAHIKQERLDRLMALQQEISAEIEASNIGKRFRVIVDRCEGDYFVGRTEYSSPEVDPEVLIAGDAALRIGEFYDVEITGSEAFDLYGRVIH